MVVLKRIVDTVNRIFARLQSNLQLMSSIRIEHPLYFYASLFAALGISLASVYLIYRDHIYVSKEKKLVPDDDLEYLGDGKDFFGQAKDDQRAEGKTDKYAWRQSDEEIELFVYLPNDEEGLVGKRDISVEIRPGWLSVSVKKNLLLNDKLCGEVISSDSSWQILDDHDSLGRRIWITLFKRQVTETKDYWPGVLVNDVKPPVHTIDSADAINKAIADIKKRK